MKNRNEKKRKRTGLKQGGIPYVCAVVWIIITCFGKHFFKNTSHAFRLRAMASVCMLAAAVVVFVEVSHSSTQVEDAHLILCMSQKGNDVTEGYEDSVVCDLVLENDGGNDLTDVRFYLEGERKGFSLESEGGGSVNDGSQDDGGKRIMAPGEKWKAKVVMAPGQKAGEYFVTVVAEAGELEKRIEQVIRFVVKEASEPEESSELEKPSGKPDWDSSAKPGKTPGPEKAPEPGETPEPEKSPESWKTPEPGDMRAPAENGNGTKKTDTPKRPGQMENNKPNVESQQADVKKPDAKPKKTERPNIFVNGDKAKEDNATEQESASKPEAATEQASADKTAETDDIIRVDVPTDARLFMNPMTSEEGGQIFSSRLPITNHSDFPLDVDIERGVLNIRQSGGFMQKSCSLNIDIFRGDQVVLAIRNLREGNNPIHTSFFLPSGNTAHMKFFGSLDAGTEYLWEDGDLSASIVFRFSKSEMK